MPGTVHDGRERRVWLFGAGAFLVIATLVVAALIRQAAWAGPALAGGLRRVFGDESVARLEELWASIEDRLMQLTHRRSAPRDLPAEPTPSAARGPAPSRAPMTAAGSEPPVATPPPRPSALEPPSDTPPPYPEVAAPHDGIWSPVADPERPDAQPLMYRTLIHPDPERSFAELFVVVMSSSAVEVRAVAGTEEPEPQRPETVTELEPRGLIPARDEPRLIAAFNGGFRARHGHHGMIVQGVTLLPLLPGLCTVAGDAAGTLRIGTWRRTDDVQPGTWYRQTPPCMLEGGVLHPGLANPESRKWGATLEGKTVIRRSAIALDERGERLYVAITNFTTARALALGMQHLGAHTVAQLDVNWSYPKILVFPRDAAGLRRAAPVFEGFLFEPAEMLRRPASRDFFYVLRR